MDYQSYLDSLRGKRIGVIGFGVSNQPLVDALLDNGCDVTICDQRDHDSLGDAGKRAEEKGAKFCLGSEYLEHLDFDLIFRTPGVLPIVPQLKAAAEKCGERYSGTHQLRHSFAKNLYAELRAKGYTNLQARQELAERLFHGRISVTYFYVEDD